MDSMTRSLGRALAPAIRVVSVAPGLVEGKYTEDGKDQVLMAGCAGPVPFNMVSGFIGPACPMNRNERARPLTDAEADRVVHAVVAAADDDIARDALRAALPKRFGEGHVVQEAE